MPRGRGHRAALEEIGTELNLVPYLDMMTTLVLFMLVNITSFLSFTMLTASIPQLSTSAEPPPAMKGAQLLLVVRMTKTGFAVDPNVQGGGSLRQSTIPKAGEKYDFAGLKNAIIPIKEKFPTETRVLVIAEPGIIYEDVIHSMDALRERTAGVGDLFPDVTLSIF